MNTDLTTSFPTINTGFRNPSKSFLHTTLQLNNNGSNHSSTLENDTITNLLQTPNSNSNAHSCKTGSNNHKTESKKTFQCSQRLYYMRFHSRQIKSSPGAQVNQLLINCVKC